MPPAPPNLGRLRHFVVAVTREIAAERDEADVHASVGDLLAELVAHDDWLPDELAQPDPAFYRQYLLAADPLGRFSVVSFVWGPGQRTPVHDHTVWGLVGVLRGAELAQTFDRDGLGRLTPRGAPVRLEPGDVSYVSPARGDDIHEVRNAFDDRTSISIHVYGADIGAVQRSVYTPEGGRKVFVSGYANAWVPNLWGRARD